MNESSAQLVEAIIGGEIHRFAEIVRRFDQHVREFISSKVTDPAAIEDLTQETFYKAFLNLERLHDTTRLQAWLVVIAKNCVTDHFRRRSSREENERLSGAQISSRKRDLSLNPKDWIWDEVETLSKEFCEVLKLRYLQSCSYDEIAQRTGLPESTIRGRIFEARKTLRQRLKSKGIIDG